MKHSDLRPPTHVMRLAQMGAMFPTRLSFLRVLLRALAAEKVQVRRPVWDMCAQGYGRAVYTLRFGGHDYALCAFSKPLAAENRTDRVIASEWDAAFVLYDGIPNSAELDRLAHNVPLQEGGRFTARDLCLSRANKSVRLFGTMAHAMQTGAPLPMGDILRTGYLMRTTAVYGNGKFGLADRIDFCDRPGMGGPFMAEMLTVWLIRGFTHDLLEHVGDAELPISVKHALGVGNATGLGMAPFLVSHPGLLHAWMAARETALARVRRADPRPHVLIPLAHRVMQHLLEWNVPDAAAQADIVALRRYWAQFARRLTPNLPDYDHMITTAAHHSPEAEELTIAWLLEAHGDSIDDLAAFMARLPPRGGLPLTCTDMRDMIATHANFALQSDYRSTVDTAQFWYVSQSKLEPRLGQRHTEPGADKESPLDIARRIAAFYADLPKDNTPLWVFLAQNPTHRMAADRIGLLPYAPYAEIQDNLIAATTHPIDMLRCKLSFFGAQKFDPKSKLWTRIALYQGAPVATDIALGAQGGDMWLSTFAP
ncbi:MAG: hypothetical protein AAF701_01820 [Pseudomonadota bacterium]